MEANLIRVINPQKFDVGVITQSNQVGINIRAGGFVMQSRDDIEYIMSGSTLFQRGFLRIEEPKEMEIFETFGIDVNTDPHFVDEQDIRKKLSGTAKSIEKWLADINEDHILDRVYDVAMDMNLNMNKIKVLQAKMPGRNFLDEDL